MSETDNFIAEVTEEVRRDRLFGALRRYGWIAAVVIVAAIGGVSWYEIGKSRAEAISQATGDALLAAIETGDDGRLAALQAVEAQGPARVIAALLVANEAQAQARPAEAVAALAGFAEDSTLPPLYRDLAEYKVLTLGAGVTDPNPRREGLEALHRAGGPFALLAQEQLALVELETGNVEAARTILQAVLTNALVSAPQRSRVETLMAALGPAAVSQ